MKLRCLNSKYCLSSWSSCFAPKHLKLVCLGESQWYFKRANPKAVLKFLLWQIKCQGNYMKIHFASALPRQCFCRGWQDFILRASAFTWPTSAKTSMRSKLVRLLPLLHISPRIRSIMCTIQFKILKDHQYRFKVRHHPLFVAAYIMIITIRFTYMKNN